MSKQMYESAYHNTQVATLQLKEPNNFQMISNASFVVEAYLINKTLIFQNLFRGCHFNIDRQRSERRQRPTDTHTCVCTNQVVTWKCFRCFRIKLVCCSKGITSFLFFTYIETLHVQKRFWHQLRRRRRWHKRNMFPNLFEFLNNFGPLRCYNFESTFCDDSERVRVFYFERESVYFLLPVC